MPRYKFKQSKDFRLFTFLINLVKSCYWFPFNPVRSKKLLHWLSRSLSNTYRPTLSQFLCRFCINFCRSDVIFGDCTALTLDTNPTFAVCTNLPFYYLVSIKTTWFTQLSPKAILMVSLHNSWSLYTTLSKSQPHGLWNRFKFVLVSTFWANVRMAEKPLWNPYWNVSKSGSDRVILLAYFSPNLEELGSNAIVCEFFVNLTPWHVTWPRNEF